MRALAQAASQQAARCAPAALAQAVPAALGAACSSCLPQHTCRLSGSRDPAAPAAAGPGSQALAARAAALAQWQGSRGFLSSLLQPESKVYRERRLIGYSPEQLYEVVSGVQHYSQFVPWCVGSHVLRRDAEGRSLEAELHIGFQMISERYTSKVTLQPPHRVSSTVADSGLFHHLESTWTMQPGPSPATTWLSFSVDFAFLNPLYANVAQLFFSEVVTRMMGAFEGRCRQLYGRPSLVAPGAAAAAAAGAAAGGGAGGSSSSRRHPRVQHHHEHHQHQQQHHHYQQQQHQEPPPQALHQQQQQQQQQHLPPQPSRPPLPAAPGDGSSGSSGSSSSGGASSQ